MRLGIMGRFVSSSTDQEGRDEDPSAGVLCAVVGPVAKVYGSKRRCRDWSKVVNNERGGKVCE